MHSAQELASIVAFGGRERVVHGRRSYEPAVGASVVRSMATLGDIESVERVGRILRKIGVGYQTAELFLTRREVYRQPPDVGGYLEARPYIPGVTQTPLSDYDGSECAYEARAVMEGTTVIDANKRKYKLNNLFYDSTTSDKLQISPRRMQAAKRLALHDPGAAAATLTEYIREHGFPNAVVTAGDYAKSVNSAVEFIRAMGRTIVYPDVVAPATVQNAFIEISFDQFHLKDVIWTVRGPLAYANEVNIVYQLSIVYGPEHVMFMLCMETAQLRIDIRNEKTGVYYTGSLRGYSSMEGIQPMGYSFPSGLSSDQQSALFRAGKKVSPVRVGDAVVGSAVHVTDKHAIMNEHTINMAETNGVVPMLCGNVIESSMSVGGDVCAVRCDGVAAQWVLREPVVGERVVLCYSVGDGVEYSEVLQVLACTDRLVLSDSNVLRQGASGAAVVALRDSALLGIFSTKRASRVYCALFTSGGFAAVADCQSVASQVASTPAEGPGDQTHAMMLKRGLMGYMEQVSASTATLYTGAHGRTVAGLVANVAGDWYTTVNPDASQLCMEDGTMLVFRTNTHGTHTVVSPPPVLQAVPNLRMAVPGERVFAFTKVGHEPIMSSVRIVSHCFADGKGFVVEDFGDTCENLDGALIVSERDAAVLGMYRSRKTDVFGVHTVHCAPLQGMVGVTYGVHDFRAVHTDLTTCVMPVEATYLDYVAYGNAVWMAAVGKKAHLCGVSLGDAISVAGSLWVSKQGMVLRDTGGAGFVEMHVNPDRERGDLALAYLAALYLREDGFAAEVVASALDGVFVADTPVVGEFPFPRASSAASSGRSRSTHSRNTSQNAVKFEELQRMEERVRKLADVVHAGEMRLEQQFRKMGLTEEKP